MKRDEALRILDKKGMTAFQKRVLICAMRIPKGTIVTYKDLASLSGNPNAYRAVGTALKNNPLPIVIPCHRVINSNGDIGGYSGGGRARKLELLTDEME